MIVCAGSAQASLGTNELLFVGFGFLGGALAAKLVKDAFARGPSPAR